MSPEFRDTPSDLSATASPELSELRPTHSDQTLNVSPCDRSEMSAVRLHSGAGDNDGTSLFS